jgi:hypothetical protein
MRGRLLVLELLVGVAVLAFVTALVTIGPLAVSIGGLVLVGPAAWIAGHDSREPSEGWPFGPRS